MARPNPGDDSNPHSGEGGPRKTPAQLATDPAFTAAYMQKAPAPTGNSGADQPALQALLDAAEAAGGGEVRLQAGLYRITGLDIGAKVALVGVGDGTRLRLNGGVNRPAIRSKNYVALMAAYNTKNWADGTPYDIRLEGFRIEGNGASNDTTSHGIALYAFRSIIRNVYVYDAGGDGIRSDGIVNNGDGSYAITGTYPEGQVEGIVQDIWIKGARGVGFNWIGPNDAMGDNIIVYGSGTSNAMEIQHIDIGYTHVFGGVVGCTIKGPVRIAHLQTENNVNEGLVVSSAPTVTNSIRRLTAFTNWTGGGSTAVYSLRLDSQINIGDAMVKCTNGENGVKVAGHHTRIENLRLNGTGAAGTYGLDINADFLDITADVDFFPSAIRRFGKNSRICARTTNCSFQGYYEPDTTGSANFLDITVNITGSGQSTWNLPASPAANTYRLQANGVKTDYFFKDYQGANSADVVSLAGDMLTSGEGSMRRREVIGSVNTTSGTLYLSYFTARKTETVANVRLATNATAAAATPTLCRVGIYSVAANGDLTLVGSIANDTALFAGAFITYTRALSASFTKTMGQRYAVGLLVVSGATMPNFYGNSSLNSSETFLAPAICAGLTAQTDLPASITAASLSATGRTIYAALLP